MTTATIDFAALTDAQFEKYSDKLSSSQYKHLVETSEIFRNRTNGTPITTKSLSQVRTKDSERPDSELGKFRAAEQEALVAPLREFIAAELAAKEADLIATLDDKNRGLSKAQLVWLNIENIPTTASYKTPNATEIEQVKAARQKLIDTRGPFTNDELKAILQTASDTMKFNGPECWNITKEEVWIAAFRLAVQTGRISATRQHAQPIVERPKVNLEPAPKTAADRKRDYLNTPVVQWRGKAYTQQMLDKMGSEDYKALVSETGHEGEVIVHTAGLYPKGQR